MDTESGTVNPDLTNSESLAGCEVEEKLRRKPYIFDFFQALRLLERFRPEKKPVGQFVPPEAEVAHFCAHPSLAFPASQIQEAEWPEDGPVRMLVNFMGMIGPEGVLPNPFTSLIIERQREGDNSLRDFLDIFNHRIISLFYRAWRKYRFDVAYERGERDKFSRHLLSLLGLGTDAMRDRQTVSDDLLIYYSGLLAQRPRSAQALQQILSDYFDVPVAIEQFSGGWYRLDPETQCRLAEETNDSGELGFGAVVGDEMWSQQSRVQIVLGPLSLERYADFLPDGQSFKPLRSWVHFFSNDEWDFELKLILDREQVPTCTLGADGISGPQLGWVSRVKSAPFQRDAGDTVLALESTKG